MTQNILQEQLQNLNKGSQKRERSEDLDDPDIGSSNKYLEYTLNLSTAPIILEPTSEDSDDSGTTPESTPRRRGADKDK